MVGMGNRLEFQISLGCVVKKARIAKVEDLVHLIISNNQIEDYKLTKNGINLKYQGEEIEINIQKKENMIFYLDVLGNKGVLDSFRSLLLNMVDRYFDEKYIIKDELSAELGMEACTYINKTQDILRAIPRNRLIESKDLDKIKEFCNLFSNRVCDIFEEVKGFKYVKQKNLEYQEEKITINNRISANKENKTINMMDELEKYYDSYVF